MYVPIQVKSEIQKGFANKKENTGQIIEFIESNNIEVECIGGNSCRIFKEIEGVATQNQQRAIAFSAVLGNHYFLWHTESNIVT